MPFRFAAIFLVLVALGRAEAPNPRVVERYKQMLSANPVEGVVLDRLWKGALESGNSDALIAEFQKKEDFGGRMVLGLILWRAGRVEEASAAFLEAANLKQESPLPDLALAALEEERGNFRAAAERYEGAVRDLPKGDAKLVEVLLKLGNCWQSAGETTKAAEAWERTVSIAPDNLSVRRQLASTYAAKYLYEPAIRHLTHVAENGDVSERPAAWREIARMHSNNGQPEAAMQVLERALKLVAPESWLRSELVKDLVRLAQRRNREAALEAEWKKQAVERPNDAGAARLMLEFHRVTGNLEEQVTWLGKLTTLLPSDLELRLQYARTLIQNDRGAEGVAQLDQLLAQQPGNADLVFERAQIAVQRGELKDASARIERLLQANPNDGSLRERANEFYQAHRMLDLVEGHLRQNADRGDEEALFKLANFYFSQRKDGEAVATLKRVTQRGGSEEERARRYYRVAEVLQSRGAHHAATESLEAALAIQPKNRGFLVLRGEIESARGNFEAARGALKQAYAVSETDEEREEVDAKLFETFRTAADAGDPVGRSKGSMAAEVEGFIRELMQEANARKDAAGWLRVARWKALNSDRASAVTFASKAADLEKENPRPREFLAKLGSANGDAVMALGHLRELVKLNQESKNRYLREIAKIELDRGETAAALPIFQDLVRVQPGDAEALADLAMAQERGAELEEALATWQRVVNVAPPHRKREGVGSLVRVLQRLGRHREAVQTMLQGLDGSRDADDRMGRLDELLLYAKQNELLDLLRTEFESRRRVRADDYFTTVALARILKLSGDKAAALDLFTDAVFSAPERGHAVSELVREAEEMRRYDISIRLQEKATQGTATGSADDFIKLADLYFKAGDLEGAERSWGRAVRKYPREAEVIRQAGEFHTNWGDPDEAVSLARRLMLLEPGDVRVLLQFAERAFGIGNLQDAKTAYEEVVRLTRPLLHQLYPAQLPASPWGERGVYAGTSRGGESRFETKLFLCTGWRTVGANTSITPDPDAELRLRAVVRLAEIAGRMGDVTRGAWKRRWMAAIKELPNDGVWALYFGGGQAEAIREVFRRMSSEPQVEGHRKAFIWMSLESGEVELLSKWLNAEVRPAKVYEIFQQAFAAVAEAAPERLTARVLDGLFPRGNSACLWTSALELSRQQQFESALRLGERCWHSDRSRRMAIGRDVARWNLALGRLEQAKMILSEVARGPAESLESPAAIAAWELFPLLTGAEQKAFAEERRKLPEDGTIPHRVARLVGAILAGDRDWARKELSALWAIRPIGAAGGDFDNSVLRFWNYAFGVHRQLVAWNCKELAVDWWRSVLGDSGLLAGWRTQKVRERVEGSDAGIWTEKRVSMQEEQRARDQMLVLEFLNGGVIERGEITAEFEREGREGVERLAELLEQHGAHASAAGVLRRVWKEDKSDPAVLRKLLDAAQQAGDVTLGEQVRAECVRENINPGNDTSPREFALELADLLQQRGAMDEAIGVIDAALRRGKDLRLMHRRAELLELVGRKEDANGAWEGLSKIEDGNAYARNAVALRMERDGKFPEALAVRRLDGFGVDPRVPVLLYKLGKTEDALQSVERLGGTEAVYAAMTLAEAMGLKGEGTLARSVLLAAAERFPEPRAQMQLRTALLTIPGHPPTAAFTARMRTKLRVIAEENPGLGEAYFRFFETYAKPLGIVDTWGIELERAWQNGTGSLEAGAALLRRALGGNREQEVRELLEQILARADAGHGLLSKLATSARVAGNDWVQLRISEFEAARGWPFLEGAFQWIQLLDRNGQGERARQVLDKQRWVSAFPGGAEKLAYTWMQLGDPERAREFYVAALKQGVAGPTSSALAGMVRVQIAAKRYEAARLLLKRAFENPGCEEYGAVIDYLRATERLGEWRTFLMEELGASPTRRHGFAIALFGFFEGAGRSREATDLVLENLHLVTPALGGQVVRETITCERLRGLARRTGAFDAVAKVFSRLEENGYPGVGAEITALDADRAASLSEAMLPHLERAFAIAPGRWEFARQLAGEQLEAGDVKKARRTLEGFLAVAIDPRERTEALELWEKSGRK